MEQWHHATLLRRPAGVVSDVTLSTKRAWRFRLRVTQHRA